MNITVGLFTERLEALCRSLDVQLHITDGDDGPYLYLMRSAEGAGSSYVDIDDGLREPPAPYVPPPPTPEELARSAERESLAAASRETWEAGFKPSEHACLECGSEGRTHLPFCSNEGGGAFGYKIEVQS